MPMSYMILVANGDVMYQERVTEADRVVIENDVYVIYGKKDKVLFSAPVDSTVYLKECYLD